MSYQKNLALLKQYNQEHLLNFWDDLSDVQKENLTKQIESIDFELLATLKKMAMNPKINSPTHKMEKADIISLKAREGRDFDILHLGEKAVKSGKVAAFLVAGGQGSRLGFDGPKGAYPITPVKRKSLFQLHAEKILAASRFYKTTIPWYIMTSQGNHEQTIRFFEMNNFFGLEKKDIMFFSQEMLPAVDLDGKIILKEKHEIFMSPNGHGGSLKAIWDSGAYQDMQKRGIEYLSYFQVDNVLTTIIDPYFLGYHIHGNAQMSSKVLRKAYPKEKIGIICKINGKTAVVEYSNLSEADALAKDENGDLKFWAGSIAIHIISLNFIEMENKQGFKLPYSIAKKNIPFIDVHGQRIKPESTLQNGYKFETFVFDALSHCENTVTVEVERENEFSALKNKTGVDSEETTLRDLNRFYFKWLRFAGCDTTALSKAGKDMQLEISPLYALNRQILREKKDKIPAIKNGLYLGLE